MIKSEITRESFPWDDTSSDGTQWYSPRPFDDKHEDKRKDKTAIIPL
jgi:hypothetical protein